MMVILDVNILLYAYSGTSPYHAETKEWLEDAMDKRTEIGLPWTTVLGFLRIITSSKPYHSAYSFQEAVDIIDEILTHSNVRPVAPTSEYWRLFKKLSREAQVDSALASDAHLATLAIERNAAVCTHDKDFRRFKGLKIIDPIKSH